MTLTLKYIACLIGLTSVADSKDLLATDTVVKVDHAQTVQHRGMSISVVSDVNAITAGKPFRMGVHIKHQKGYHTYWRNPGAVGFSTQLKWKLPEGFKAGEIHWPTPQKSLMTTIKCNGYERDVTLYVDITPPATLESDQVDIEFIASWMCCGKECNPGTQKFKKQFAVTATPIPNIAGSALIETAKLELPSKICPFKVELLSQPTDQVVQLKLSSDLSSALSKVQVFSLDNQLDSNAKRHISTDQEGNVRISIRRSELSVKLAKSLPLVIVLNGKGYQINSTYLIKK